MRAGGEWGGREMLCVCVCERERMCVCVCVCERERDRMCVCVCSCVRTSRPSSALSLSLTEMLPSSISKQVLTDSPKVAKFSITFPKMRWPIIA